MATADAAMTLQQVARMRAESRIEANRERSRSRPPILVPHRVPVRKAMGAIDVNAAAPATPPLSSNIQSTPQNPVPTFVMVVKPMPVVAKAMPPPPPTMPVRGFGYVDPLG